MNMLVSLIPPLLRLLQNTIFAIGTQTWEASKSFIAGDLPDITAIQVDPYILNGELPLYSWFTAEKEMPRHQGEVERPVGLLQVGDLTGVAAIHIGDPYFHMGRRH